MSFHAGTAAAQPQPDLRSGDSGSRPPANTQLAFVRDDQIWLVNADGSGLIRLTEPEPGVANMDPAWSRDGQRLAFARSMVEDGPWDIYIMDADGSNVIQLTSEVAGGGPAWGPDDRTILFTSFLSGGLDLTVIDVDASSGAGSRVFLNRQGYDAHPAWSPDGRTITFTSDWRAYDFLYDLWAINADGSNVRPLLQGPFESPGAIFYYQSAWSPDGQSISVVGCPDGHYICFPESAIVVVNADGSGRREIAQAGGFASPTWSSDGQWIAFSSSQCRDCESSIRYVRVDGGIEGLIVENGHSPSWRPASGANVNVGHSGAWFNPATPGQGQFLEVEPDRQFVFLGWLTYTDDASDNPNEQHWFTAEGHYVDNRAELILYESVGGEFNQAQPVETTRVGEATLTFSDCRQATMSYRFDDHKLDDPKLDEHDLEGSFPMVRAIPGSGNVCESSGESTTQAVGVNDGMNGAWSDPAASGQGFFFDVHAGDDDTNFIFVSWFTYGNGTASGQRWLTAEGRFAASKANLVIYDTHGGSFDDSRPTQSVQVGTMRIDFSDCSHAVLSYSLPDEGSGGTIDIQRTVPGSQALCEALNTLE